MSQQNKPRYFLVEASVLPEIFLRVAEAKELMETGEARTVAQAVEQSRIQFEQQLTERLPSFQFAIAVEGVRGTGRKRGIEA